MANAIPEFSIVTRALTKRFGTHVAVDALDLMVETGQLGMEAVGIISLSSTISARSPNPEPKIMPTSGRWRE